MNRQITYLFVGLSLFIVLFGASNSYTYSDGAPAGYSGAISDFQQNCSECHSTSASGFNFAPEVTITSELLENEDYELGESYYIAIVANSVGVERFGFQACMENEFGYKVGELVLSDVIHTQLVDNGNYITHTELGSVGSGVKTWVFNWIAPDEPVGAITLHTSVLFSNNNGLTTGDEFVYTSMSFSEPEYGCTLPSAYNYDINNDIDDGSCLFGFSSEVLSVTFENVNVYGSEGEELEVYLNVHNNSDTDLVIHAQRNLPVNTIVPTNWFCWSVCYTPNVNQSAFGIEIPSGSYTDEFSGHLIGGFQPGTYPIEYCFYQEGYIEDSLCTTVNYIVDGEVYGCTDFNAINYSSNANVDDGTCVLFPEPNWEYSVSYGYSHNIAVSSDVPISINEESISVGDWIGVFYNSDEGLICAGYTEWSGENTNIEVQGFDPVSNQGFIINEEFIWQVWDASNGVSWPMSVQYSESQQNQGEFVNNGFSVVSSMENIIPITNQILSLPEGWSMFSTYIGAEDMNLMSLLEPIEDQLIIVKNNNGDAYIVEYAFNAIGDMIPGQGYLLKTTSEVELTIDGEYLKPELFPINLQEGWNMIGYLKDEPQDANVVFADLIAIDAIQIVKDYTGNALIPEYNYNGIGELAPGGGYQVKTLQQVVLQY